MPQLTVKLGDKLLQTHEFEGKLLRVGRSRENDIVLENLSVSRQHIQIRYHDSRYILTDMNSANGTLLNGVRVTKTELVDEDVITLGKHTIIFSNPDLATLLLEQDHPGQQPAESQKARLVVESGRLSGREFVISRFETSLGRAASNDIVITDDWLLGKKQAILLRKGNNQYEVQDLGGLRRVKLNGKAISERADVNDGDTIELGSTKLRFVAGAEVPKSPRKPKAAKPPQDGELPELSPADMGAQTTSGESVGSYASLDNDSLDLEDAPSPRNETKKMPEVAAPDAAEEPSEQQRQPATVRSNANVFEDRKNNARKKSRQNIPSAAAHAEARPQAEPANSPNGNSAAVNNSDPVARDAANVKEIQMWEEALKSPSPAIRRQAARTLKQLTGTDYES